MKKKCVKCGEMKNGGSLYPNHPEDNSCGSTCGCGCDCDCPADTCVDCQMED